MSWRCLLVLVALTSLLPAQPLDRSLQAPVDGRVTIQSVPSGARVYGQTYAANRPQEDILGVTPCVLPVDTRFSHTFTVALDGYAAAKVRLDAGREGPLQVKLQPATLGATLAHPFRLHPYLSILSVLAGACLILAASLRLSERFAGLRRRVLEAGLEVPELVGRTVDDYRVLELLGEGSLAQVYRVVHRDYGDEFALKWLKPQERTPQALRRFQRELALGKELSHPRLVRVLGFGTCAGSPYLVMELVRGRTLAVRLLEGSLSRTEALQLGIEVCQALEELHSRGLVHRDLKPENMMLSPTGVRLLDYGALKGEACVALTASGTALGTPLYMSPEHLNARRVDHRSDLYSLGVVLYEALSGRLPFVGEDAAQVLAGHLYESPAPLVGVDPDVARVVSWLMAKNPAERPEHARMARQALERLLLARAV